MYRPKGRYVSINPLHPQAVAMCDYSQMIFMRKDLVKQMEYRGNALVWTGFYVGKPFADEPNPQLIPPILPPDPIPVTEPRLQQGTIPQTNGVLAFPEPQRLSALQSFNWTGESSAPEASSLAPNAPEPNELSVDGIPALPEAERLRLLQNFNWRS